MPLISVVIPTLNEAAHIEGALASLQGQAEHETLVVDSGSQDGTRESAVKMGARLIDYPGKPLGARYRGVQEAKGEFILLLDADQVLRPDCLKHCLAAIKDKDLLILGESSFEPKGFTQRSISRNKKAIEEAGRQGDYLHMYPRFFRKDVLLKAYALIPEDLLPTVFVYDDALLFSKLRQVSERISFVPEAVLHHEEESMTQLIRHSYRMGKSAAGIGELNLPGFYRADSPPNKFKKAVKGRYLTVAMFRELSFQLGRRF
ncbi:MAG: glycosyltransferase [Methanomassiliicoccales archaeon]